MQLQDHISIPVFYVEDSEAWSSLYIRMFVSVVLLQLLSLALFYFKVNYRYTPCTVDTGANASPQLFY